MKGAGQLAVLALASVVLASAQTPEGLAGKWEGALQAGPQKLRLILEVSKASDGAFYIGTLVSVDQGSARIPIDKFSGEDGQVRFEAAAVGGSFEGTMNADKTKIAGTWTQGQPLALELTRTADVTKAEPNEKGPTRVPNPFGVPVDVRVGSPPTPFSSGGKRYLAYELHLTNFFSAEVMLDRIEVLTGGSMLASFEGPQLNAVLMRPGKRGLKDKRAIGPGLAAVAYLWVELDAEASTSGRLRHRIHSGEQSVDGGETEVVEEELLALGPPLKGGPWLAANGPGNGSIHRRALIPVDGRVQGAQRFAIDWMKLGADGKPVDGDSKKNEGYYGYGEDLLAVADATVVATKDGIAENVPGLRSRAVKITRETIGGNYVILDLGAGRYAFYAHLQPGSLKVAKGDRVKRGEVLGLLGNSGNSTAPHLHFHVSNGPLPLAAEGIPYVIDAYEVSDEPRQKELPLLNERVTFVN